MTRELRHGYTTGACAAAAAKGAALMLVHQLPVHEVTIDLPAGVAATFKISGHSFNADSASCLVIKDAGDDPDVTNGAEVHVTVSRDNDDATAGSGIVIQGGNGIGRVTKPGLAIPPGEWAINPVPRSMITKEVASVIRNHGVVVTVSIPDGEERAHKTLNARLGIIGGLSILGTTGIVRPISTQAWTDTIDAALDVAKACKCETVVLSTGRSSELAVQNHLKASKPSTKISKKSAAANLPLFPLLEAPDQSAAPLPEEAYIMMGDHIAYALRACAQRGFNRPIIACQFAKLLKIACGHENTHAAASELDISRLLEWARQAGLPKSLLEIITNANTAREIALACSFNAGLIELVFKQARSASQLHTPGMSPQFMVADYSGNCVYTSH